MSFKYGRGIASPVQPFKFPTSMYGTVNPCMEVTLSGNFHPSFDDRRFVDSQNITINLTRANLSHGRMELDIRDISIHDFTIPRQLINRANLITFTHGNIVKILKDRTGQTPRYESLIPSTNEF